MTIWIITHDHLCTTMVQSEPCTFQEEEQWKYINPLPVVLLQVNDVALESLTARSRFLQRLNLSWCHRNIVSEDAFCRSARNSKLSPFLLTYSVKFLQVKQICCPVTGLKFQMNEYVCNDLQYNTKAIWTKSKCYWSDLLIVKEYFYFIIFLIKKISKISMKIVGKDLMSAENYDQVNCYFSLFCVVLFLYRGSVCCRYIAACGGSLQHLYLSSCSFVTDKTLQAIVTHCPNLTGLHN